MSVVLNFVIRKALGAAGVMAFAFSLTLTAAEAEERAYATGVVFHDRNGNGVRDAGEEGIPGVRVSNQREIVETDEEGRWRLPVEDDETIFFVVKPAGWMTPVDENNLPQFYYIHKPHGSPRELYFPGVDPTGPLPDSIDFPLHPQDEPDDFSVIFVGDPQARTLQELDWMRTDSIPEMARAGAAFGVTLGDIVHNQLWLFEPTAEAFSAAGIPWYNVIGNHDINFDATEDRYASSTFQRVFGPPYYSFEYGDVHFIVLDNIRWHPLTGPEPVGYFAGFGPRQMEFIRNNLERVPRDRMVVLMMHIQWPDRRWDPYQHEVEELFELLADRPHRVSVAGHRHRIRHRFVDESMGWQADEPLYHLIVPALGGAQWAGPPDHLGIPRSIQPGGSPRGYFIFHFAPGGQYFARFKASRRPDDYQMHIWSPLRVAQDLAGETEIYANVFAGNARSTVEMRLGEHGEWRPMEQTVERDPYQVDGSASEHLWKATLPENPPIGAHAIHVRTTDMFGKTHHGSHSVTVVPGFHPGDGATFADASEGLRISFASESPREELRLVLNGEDRSGDLDVEGDLHQWQARIDLQANRAYEGELRVTKGNGRTIAHAFRFDTYDPESFAVAAVDYNFDGGRFIEGKDVEAYRGKSAVQYIDKLEINYRGVTEYRPEDGVSTGPAPTAVAGEDAWEPMRRLNLPEYVIGGVATGEWLNYTRTFPQGRYHVFGSFIYGRYDGGPTAQMDRVTSDPSQPDQTTEKLGVFGGERNSGSWWNPWYYPLQHGNGELAVVELDGLETLRVTNLGGSYGAAFYIFVPVEE